ncbi:MAG: hypothetical protein IJM85_06440 [Clostridia bacterium]|nr:hypothetical protein [Clostridia bacterium]
MNRDIAPFMPLLAYPILLYPYKLLNEKVLVEKLGCGCPSLDSAGNVIERFNANDFTMLFWQIVAFLVTVAAAILAHRCDKRWKRLAFPMLVAAAAFALSYLFISNMIWL